MVTVDDATYVKMRDTLYWGDAWKASKAKAQIESSYDDAKYNSFLWQLNSMQTPASNSSNSNSWPADGYATATEDLNSEGIIRLLIRLLILPLLLLLKQRT